MATAPVIITAVTAFINAIMVLFQSISIRINSVPGYLQQVGVLPLTAGDLIFFFHGIS